MTHLIRYAFMPFAVLVMALSTPVSAQQTLCPEAAKHLEDAEYFRAEAMKNLEAVDAYENGKNKDIGEAIDALEDMDVAGQVSDIVSDFAFEGSTQVLQNPALLSRLKTTGGVCLKVGAKVVAKANAIVSALNTAINSVNIAEGVMAALNLPTQAMEDYQNNLSRARYNMWQAEKAMQAYADALKKCGQHKCIEAADQFVADEGGPNDQNLNTQTSQPKKGTHGTTETRGGSSHYGSGKGYYGQTEQRQ